jgi:hypothetical protein
MMYAGTRAFISVIQQTHGEAALDESHPHIEAVPFELLPDIYVAMPGDPRAALEAMARLAEDDVSLTVERHFDAPRGVGWHVVNIRSSRPSERQGLGGQMISRPDLPNRIAIEMRAFRWMPDAPSRDAYVSAARALFVPLLRAYNRAYRSRHRLYVEPAREPNARVPPATRALLDRFAILANPDSLHPLDWRRFYRFVKESRRELPMEVVRALLIERDFARDRAHVVAELYRHLWAYKRLE